MSLKDTSGTSLVEVMVMMVILGISIVGIYTMVDSGQKLATLSDTRLNAVNIAREGLESVTTLRDTFALNNYQSGTCTDALSVTVNAFFSIDAHALSDHPSFNCPVMGTAAPLYNNKPYILKDDKALADNFAALPGSFNVCINEFGWYSQEYSVKNAVLPATPISCSTTNILCGANTTQSCKTKFKRKITFRSDESSNCGDIKNSQYCVEVFSTVWWGTDPDDTDTSLTLQQIITPLD